MASHTDEEFYSYVQRALDGEKRILELENQLQKPPQQTIEPASPVPTISRSDLNDVQKLRSLFPERDITRMIINGEIKIAND